MGGKKCGNNSVLKIKAVGVLCMCACVPASLKEKPCNGAHRSRQPGRQMCSYFFEVIWPLTVPQQEAEQTLRLRFNHKWNGHNNKIFYIWQSFMKCFFTVRDLFLLLWQNTGSVNCRQNSPIIQLHVRGTSHLMQWIWVFLGRCNWWF